MLGLGGLKLFASRRKMNQNVDNTAETTIILDEEDLINHNEQTPDATEKPESFNWEKVLDKVGNEINQSKQSSWFSKLPMIMQYLFYCLAGSAVILIPGLISYFFFIEDYKKNFLDLNPKGSFSIEGLPFFIYSIYLIISWCTLWTTIYFFLVLPEILIRISNLVLTIGAVEMRSKVSHTLLLLENLRIYSSLMVWCIINAATWSIMFSRQIQDPNSSLTFILRILISGNIISIGFFTEKAILQIFASNFHRKAYKDRLITANFSSKVLENLSKSFSKEKQPGVDREANATAAGLINAKYLKNGLKKFKNVFDAISGVDLQTKAGVRHFGNPYKLAKRLFILLSRNENNFITQDDFGPYFESMEESLNAFQLFDSDNNGDISRDEFKHTIVEIYGEHSSLEDSIRQSSQAIDKLDSILQIVLYVVLLFLILGVFNVSTSQFLTSAIALWAGTLFAIGGTIKNVVESIIFLFFTHPYDVGDRVTVNGNTYQVKAFGLMTSIFLAGDGTQIYAPNIVLTTQFIQNHRRSGPQSEDIRLLFNNATTSLEQIEALRLYLLEYLEVEEKREFFPSLTFLIKEMNFDTILVMATISHKTNFQDAGRRSLRRNRFLKKVRAALVLFKIELASSQLAVPQQ